MQFGGQIVNSTSSLSQQGILRRRAEEHCPHWLQPTKAYLCGARPLLCDIDQARPTDDGRDGLNRGDTP
jgi:hypothetical protein